MINITSIWYRWVPLMWVAAVIANEECHHVEMLAQPLSHENFFRDYESETMLQLIAV